MADDRDFHMVSMDNHMIVTTSGSAPLGDAMKTPQGESLISFVLQGVIPDQGFAEVTSPVAALAPYAAAQLIAELLAAADRAGWGPKLRAMIDQRVQDAREFYRQQPRREGPITDV